MSDTSPQLNSGPRLERFHARDLRVLIIWVLAGALGVGVAWKYFFQAFPEASVNFQVSRDESLNIARQFVTNQGAALEGYQSTIVFNVDDTAKTYLERTVGLEQANQLISTQLNIWYWDVRFFRPQQKEEYRAQISPAGRVVGYRHIVDETRPGARLTREAALAIAENFIRAQDPARFTKFDLVPEEANSTEPNRNRLDWSFTWQLRGFRSPDTAEGALYRLRVGVQGDRIGNLREFLKVPDAWARDFNRMRSGNNLIELIAIIPYLLLIGAAFLMIYEYSRLGLLRWAGPVWLGVFLALLFFFMTINTWPSTRSDYDTNSSYSSFILAQIAIALALSVTQAFLVTLTVAPGEPLYRQTQPSRLRLWAAWKFPAWRSKEFFSSCVIGLSLAAVHIGYVVAFYLIGKRFGVWAPQDINFDDAASSVVPWLAPLTIGIYAATSEEFLFRMFAIPFVQRITKSKLLAVVLPAFAWGFLHANYPQEPPYIRGIEIGLIGIVAGLVMLRWGILTTLIWHYTVDATLGSLLLMRSTSPYLKISGALVAGAAAIPLIYAAVMYFARGGFEVREDLLNRADPLIIPESATEATESLPAADTQTDSASATSRARAFYQSISRGKIWALVLCGIAGIAVLVTFHQRAIGDFLRVSDDRFQIVAKADDVLRQWRVDPSHYRRAVVFVSNFDPLTNEFLRRKVGIGGTNQIYEQQVQQAFWRARYFRDSEAEEYEVVFRMDGGLHSVWHTLEESAPGAKLTEQEALARGEAWLRDNKQLNLAEWRLVDSKQTTNPKRTDHTLVWERTTPLAGGQAPEDAAFARVELQVQGDEISHFRNYIKLPDDWVRQQQRQTLPRTIQTVWHYVLLAGVPILLLITYFRNLRHPASQSIPWKKLALWTLWAFAATAVSSVTNFPFAFHTYDTRIPLSTFLVTLAIVSVLALLVFTAAVAFSFGLAWFLWTRAGRAQDLPAWLGMPADYYRDALLLASAGSAAWLGIGALLNFLSQHWQTLRAAMPASAPFGLDALSPAAQAIASTVFSSLLYAAAVAAIAGFIAVFVRPLWMRALGVIAVALAGMGGWGSTPDFARQFFFYLVLIVIAWWGLTKFVRFNLLGFFLLLATVELVGVATNLLQQPNAYLHRQGIFVLAFLAVLLLWPVIAWLKPSPIDRPTPE